MSKLAEILKRLPEIKALAEKATPGPWRSMRDGNQYLGTFYMPTATLVASSRVEGPLRPWNPHAYVSFGFRADEFEVVRFTDADADFVAANRSDVPALVEALEEARELLTHCERIFREHDADRQEGGGPECGREHPQIIDRIRKALGQ